MARTNWAAHIAALVSDIERDGWTVKHGRQHARLAGQCRYDDRAILLYERGKMGFMTLCHEDGHRRAFNDFQEFGATTDALFTAMNPARAFREYQACVYGWHTLRRYTCAITMAEWIDFNSECLTLAVEYAGER